MKLQYDDTIDEAADVQYQLAEMTGAIAGRRWVGFIVPTVVLALTFLLFWNSPFELIAGASIAAGVLAIDLATYKKKIRHSFRKSLISIRGSEAPVTTEYELHDTGISIRQRGQELKTDWSTVVSFQQSPDQITLVLNPPGIIAIPTRAFSSEQQRRDWIGMIARMTNAVE